MKRRMKRMTDRKIEVLFERETKRTYRYKTDDMAQTYYFPKDWFTGSPPATLQLTIHIPDGA
jgi:hypothetical protein